MKRRTLLVTVLFVVAMIVTTVVPASACTQGCTPGYWKQEQHFDSWVNYRTYDYFDEIFGVGPHITLLDALWARGGGENALRRHAVAALLNANRLWPAYNNEDVVINYVQWAYHDGKFEHVKNVLEGWNESGCPLN
jgi:hypothetical protein